MLATEHSRAGLIDALRRRHHYATTGCRMVLDVRAHFGSHAERFDDDPNLGPSPSRRLGEAMMGDIVRCGDDEVRLDIDIVASSPVERVDIRNGLETLETFRPFDNADLGRRIRVIWEGSEYRGRGRQTIWDGEATLTGNRFEKAAPINYYNLDKIFEPVGDRGLRWTALTTGGFGGFDAWLADGEAGTLRIDTPLVKCELRVADIGREDTVFDAGGIERRIRVFRMPDENPHTRLELSRRISLQSNADNALYVRVVQEDGHLIWSSPIYVFR